MNQQSQSISLHGQVAMITGGSRGIGRAIAQKFASAGAKIAVLARSAGELAETVRLIEQSGGHARAFVADVTAARDVETAVKAIEKSLGPVDVLVNNAGTVKPFGPLWETDIDEWWQGIDINLHGPMLCSRAVLPGMVTRKRGRIINVSSGAGAMAMPFYTSYVVSKTALNRFTECLAQETGPHGIAVFAISPGTVRTAMTEYSLHSKEGQKWLPWFRRIFDEGIDVPADRPAQLVLELASGRADSLSGRFVSVFDDLELLIKNAEDIKQRNLYSLKMEKLPSAGGNPALASVLVEAQRAADREP